MSNVMIGDEYPDSAFDAAIEAGWIDPSDVSKAMSAVMNERDRQRNEEGWTPEHDDGHTRGELAGAAACYALASLAPGSERTVVPPQSMWMWSAAWWKPKDRRSNLVRATALLIAEIERLDRIEASGAAR